MAWRVLTSREVMASRPGKAEVAELELRLAKMFTSESAAHFSIPLLTVATYANLTIGHSSFLHAG